MVLYRPILQTLRLPRRTQGQKMIPKRLRDLIKQAEMDKVAEDFWKEVEAEAAKLEVTVDYYLAEFY
jgi:hypothetical protein